MLKVELEAFEELLGVQAKVFGKDPPSQLIVQAYWDALRDAPLDAVRRAAQNHLRKGKFFPKPVDLRPKEIPAPEAKGPDPMFATVIRQNAANWREFQQRDPELAEIELAIAKVGRVLAVDRLDSPQHAEAIREDRHWRDARQQLIERRRLAGGAT